MNEKPKDEQTTANIDKQVNEKQKEAKKNFEKYIEQPRVTLDKKRKMKKVDDDSLIVSRKKIKIENDDNSMHSDIKIEAEKSSLNEEIVDDILQIQNISRNIEERFLSGIEQLSFNEDEKYLNVKCKLNLEQADVKILTAFLTLAEASRMDITKTSILSVVQTSNLIYTDEVQKLYSDFIAKKLSPRSACFYYKVLSKTTRLIAARRHILNYIERGFELIVKTESFLELSFELVEEILSSDELNVTSESKVLQAAEAWVNHHKEERIDLAPEVFSKVRLDFMSTKTLKDFISRVSNYPFYKKVENSLIKAIRNSESSNRCGWVGCRCVGLTKTRHCSQTKFKVLVFGSKGFQQKKVLSIYEVDDEVCINDEKKWQLPKTVFHTKQSASIDGTIYIFGQKFKSNDKSTYIEAYTPRISKCWKVVGSITENLTRFCVCSFQGLIYIIGGNTNSKTTSSCTTFNPKQGKWSSIPNMNVERESASCSVFGGKLVVSGGLNNQKILKTVEVFDPDTNKWTFLNSMVRARYGHISIATNNKIYIIHGTGCESCEFYDSSTNVFERVSQDSEFKALDKNLNYNTAVLMGNHVLVYYSRGLDHFNAVYDLESRTWSEKFNYFPKDFVVFSAIRIPEY